MNLCAAISPGAWDYIYIHLITLVLKSYQMGPGRWAAHAAEQKQFLWLEIAFLIFAYFCVIFDEK